MEQEYVLSSTDEKLLVDLRGALHAKKKGLPMNSVQTIINCEKHEDNSVHIGDGNKISNSTIGSKNTILKPGNPCNIRLFQAYEGI